MGKTLDGSRVRALLGSDTRALLATYRQFEDLVPAAKGSGAAHPAEDGRFVEALVRSYLRPLLPTDLEVATGFIMRPAVKTGIKGRERKGEKDAHSGQLDVIVFDSAHYPVFQRFEDSVVVPPESVVAIISVKKHLRMANVSPECVALRRAASLCRCLDSSGEKIRGPFLAISAMGFADPPTKIPEAEKVFGKLKNAYEKDPSPTFDEVVGLIGTVDGVSVFKKRPTSKKPTEAEFLWIEHREGEDHWALHLLLTGILSVYYDSTRNHRRRPGFSGFLSGRAHDGDLGVVIVSCLR